MFAGMRFSDLRRMQLDIEVVCEGGGFPSASRAGDRIIAVGISGGGGEKIIELEDFTDDAERKLLETLRAEILARDPDTIEGHNIFKFDIPYIAERSKRLKIPLGWGRFGGSVAFRKSRLTIAERTFAYTRCDIAGRTVVDTLPLVQLYDIGAREMVSYTLKESAIHFGISDKSTRTYIRRRRHRRSVQDRQKDFPRLPFRRSPRDRGSCRKAFAHIRRAGFELPDDIAGVSSARFGHEG